MKKLSSFRKALVLFAAVLTGMASLQAAKQIAPGVTLISPSSSSTYFSTIQAAYDAVDFSAAAGAYTIEVASGYNASSETFPINLTAKALASEANTITLRPAAGVTKTFSSASKAISFNGAKFVTIDGRAGGVGTEKGFTFENTDITSSAKTIEFVNDAYKNTLKYCTVLGAQVAATGGSPAPITSGNIVIGTTTGTEARGGDATAGFTGSGNLYNTIDNCDIADASTGLPTAGVCMIGTATYTNEGNVVSNCNIYNYFNPGNNYSAGIFVGAYSQSSVITANKMYQTAERTFNTYGQHTPLHITSPTKEVSFNTIGYSSNLGTGVYTIGGAQSHKLQAMFITNNVSTMKGNIISDIEISTTSVGGPNVGMLVGIYCGGNVYPAGDAANPNIIRNITLNVTRTYTSTFTMAGIVMVGWTGGTIAYNTIDNLKVNFTGADAATIKALVYGIYGINAWGINAKQNRISNITVGAEGNSGANTITAIYGAPQASQVVIADRNEIYNLNSISTGAATINGILPNNGTGYANIYNNVIVLGNDMSSGAEIRGIYKSNAGKMKAYHNTIYIGGEATGTTANTYCLFRNSATPAEAGEELVNNIFVNKRTGGATGNHYAVKMLNAADYNDGFITFNNNLLLTDASSKLAFIGADVADFAAFSSTYPNFASGCVNADPMFVDPTAATPDMHISSASSPANTSGVGIASVSTDFTGATRADYTPADMGAYVIAGSTNVENATITNCNIFGAKDGIQINNLCGQQVQIFALNGQMLKSIRVNSNKETVSLNAGMYIVKAKGQNVKVLLK